MTERRDSDWTVEGGWRPRYPADLPVLWQLREGRPFVALLLVLMLGTFLAVHALFLPAIGAFWGELPAGGRVLLGLWLGATAWSAWRDRGLWLSALLFTAFLLAFLGPLATDMLGRSRELQGQEGKPWMAFYTLYSLPLLTWAVGRRRRPVPKYLKSTWQLTRERFLQNRLAQVGLLGVVGLYVVTFLAPFLAPYAPNLQVDIVEKALIEPFTRDFPLGTDNYSRDMLSRLLHGAWISMTIGIFSVGLSITIGLVVGLLAGYFGGWVDWFLMRMVDYLLSLPRLVLLLVVLGLLKDVVPNEMRIHVVIGILGLTGWMGTSRLVRGEVLSVKERDFVTAGRALGLDETRLIFRHVAPNCLSPVIVSATLGVGGTILVEAGLSFLGFGVPPPTATWGAMVDQGREFMVSGPWITILPGLCIVFAVTSFNLLGDGLRDAMDPKLASAGRPPRRGREPEPEDGDGAANQAAPGAPAAILSPTSDQRAR